MTKEEKGVYLEELREKFSKNIFIYVMDAGGMSVEDTNKFRRFCFEKGMEYKVIKNSLIKKALESLGGDYSGFHPVLKGFSGVLLSSEDGSTPAKMLKEYRKKGNPKPVFKGASIDASFFIGEDQLDALTNIKSKRDVLAELLGMLQSPGSNLVRALKAPSQQLASALQSGGNNVHGLLKALAEKKENEG